MPEWPNRRALLRRVGLRRITSAEDFEDRWGERIASMLKPRNMVPAIIAGTMLTLLLMVALLLGGYGIASPVQKRILSVVESAIPEFADLDGAELRVRTSATVRAIELIDRAITSRPGDPSKLRWYARLFGRQAPQVDPGKEAVFLTLVDLIASKPVAEQADLAEQMILWAGSNNDQHVWAILKAVGELPADIRQVLMASNADEFRRVLAWLAERRRSAGEIRGLTSAVAGEQAELDDQRRRVTEQIQSMARERERGSDVRNACERHIRDFEACTLSLIQRQRTIPRRP